jgi:predicted ArsR family transcriptional regulator
MRPAGAARQSLARLLDAGMTGTYRALAAAAGVPEPAARATLKELSRCGHAAADERARRAAPAVYARAAPPLDTLAYVRQAWR